MHTPRPKPLVLLILDGWGIAPPGPHNAIHLAHTPVMDTLCARCPPVPLTTHGPTVGLPEGQMGNSEVGHMHIGAGRVIHSELSRIDHQLSAPGFPDASPLGLILQQRPPTIHVMGLLSDGGVHAHQRHWMRILEILHTAHQPFVVHPWLDGRDTPPRSAHHFLSTLSAACGPWGKMGSLIGRYWAMDRDHRWNRTEQAYRLWTQGIGEPLDHHEAALATYYQRGIDDEFIPACRFPDFVPVSPQDAIIAMNFRADRMRQITQAWIDPAFSHFARPWVFPASRYISLAPYDPQWENPVLSQPQRPQHTLGAVLAAHGLTQLRAAETEKYAHVTFFFNGGEETPGTGETRILIPSPAVATYDREPAMSAPALTDALITTITEQRVDVIIANFANGDMVGHTGQLAATIRAIETIDACLGRIYRAIEQVGGGLLITADHGNAECLYDPETQQPHTAHTHSPVPCLYIGPEPTVRLHASGSLADVAPTVLSLLDLPIPSEMTGHPLFQCGTRAPHSP